MSTMYFSTVALLVACAVLVSAAPVWETKEDIARAAIEEQLAELIQEAKINQWSASQSDRESSHTNEQESTDSLAQSQTILNLLEELNKQQAEAEAFTPTKAATVEGKQEKLTFKTLKQVIIECVNEKLSELEKQDETSPTVATTEEATTVPTTQATTEASTDPTTDKATVTPTEEDIDSIVERLLAKLDGLDDQEQDDATSDETEQTDKAPTTDILQDDRDTILQDLSTKLSKLQAILEQINENLAQEESVVPTKMPTKIPSYTENLSDLLPTSVLGYSDAPGTGPTPTAPIELGNHDDLLLQVFLESLKQLEAKQQAPRPPMGRK